MRAFISKALTILLSLLIFSAMRSNGQSSFPTVASNPLRLGIIGLAHDHVHGVLQNMNNPDIRIVGIAESDTALVSRYVKQYHLDRTIIYPTLEELIAKTHPEAVSVFSPISEHINVVRVCAPKKIHVMVEKLLAINYAQALEMKKLSDQWGIQVVTNYETTWYPVTRDAYNKTIEQNLIGEPRKIVFHDGHKGPIEIGCSKEFTNWLTDPKTNGGGAITDFGCYGADMVSYLMNGERPLSVTAITQQIKPKVYPKVDDEATIIITYPRAQCIIQASWNWPIGRKDMEIYGKTGYLITSDNVHMRIKTAENSPEQQLTIGMDQAFASNPFSYFAAIVRGVVKPLPNDPSTIGVNLAAMEILDCAVISAKEGKTVFLKH